MPKLAEPSLACLDWLDRAPLRLTQLCFACLAPLYLAEHCYAKQAPLGFAPQSIAMPRLACFAVLQPSWTLHVSAKLCLLRFAALQLA